MPGRTFTKEFKLAIVQAIESGEKTTTQTCRGHNLAQSVVNRWREEYRTRGDGAFSASPKDQSDHEVAALQAKIAELERFIGQQSYEISILKKTLNRFPPKDGAK